MNHIEETLSKNSVAGVLLSFFSSALAQIKLLSAEVVTSAPTFGAWLVDMASYGGIIIGLLTGCLTLAINLKKFIKEFFPDDTKRKRAPRKRSSSKATTTD